MQKNKHTKILKCKNKKEDSIGSSEPEEQHGRECPEFSHFLS